MKIEDVDVRAEPDSRAEVNVLDEHQFKALTNRSNVKLTLQPSRVKLSTLQSELPMKGVYSHHKEPDLWSSRKICCDQRKNQLPTPHQQKYPSRAGYVTDQRRWLFR